MTQFHQKQMKVLFKYSKLLFAVIALVVMLLLYVGLRPILSQNHDIVTLIDEDSDDMRAPQLLLNESNVLDMSTAQLETASIATELMVDVKGAVNFPGVYTLKEGDRVIDAIAIAGGFTQEADSSVLNQAEKVYDQMVIQVLTHEQVEDQQGMMSLPTIGKESVSSSQSTRININQADVTQLLTLPGIGEKKAQAIIEYRESIGGFDSIDQIKEVKGIGERTFDSLQSLISVN